MRKTNILFSLMLLSIISYVSPDLGVCAQNPLYSVDFISPAGIADWKNAGDVVFGNDATIGNYMVAEGSAASTALRSADFKTKKLVFVEFDMMLPDKKTDGTENTIGGGNTGGVALMNGTTVAGLIGFRGSGSGTPDHILSTGGTSTDYINVTNAGKATAYREMWLHYTFVINTSGGQGDFYITNPADGVVYSYPGKFDSYIKNITSVTNIGIVSNSGYAIGIANLKVTDPVVSQLTLSAKNNEVIQYIPSPGYVSNVQYNADAKYNICYNNAGNRVNTGTFIDVPDAKIVYSIIDSQGNMLSDDSPVRISDTGLLTIQPEAVPGEYTINAKCGNVEDNTGLSIRIPGKADKLEITGDEILTVTEMPSTYQFRGIASVNGIILDNKTIVWSLQGDNPGCSIDEETGLLTVPANCQGGKLIVRAYIASDDVIANYVVHIRTEPMVANSNYNVKGAVLMNGIIEMEKAAGVSEIIIQKLGSSESATDRLIVNVYNSDDRLIAKKTINLDNSIEEGIQPVALGSGLLFENASYIISYVTGMDSTVITRDIPKITSGSYKQIPLVSDWITNPVLGNGPGVMNPSRVPAGIRASTVNTKNLNVTYRYDSDYPQIVSDNILWYKTGAYDANSSIYDRDGSDWEKQALPIGNGYMGAMLFGMPGKDHIQFNEESFWAAGYRGVQSKVSQTYINPGMSEGINGYMNAGNIFVDFGLPQNPTIYNYYRDLNLDDAVAHVQYTYNDITYYREYFASYPAEVLVFRYTADTEGALNFSVNPVSAHPGNIRVNNGEIRITGKLKDSEPYSSGGNAAYNQESDLEYCTIVKVVADDGTIQDDYAKVNITNASSVTIIITAATDYDPDQFVINADGTVDIEAKQFKNLQGVQYAIDKASARIANTEGKTYNELKSEHIADYRNIFNRVNFRLTGMDEVCRIPTDELQAGYKNVISGISAGEKVNFSTSAYNSLNKHLEELHFNYARYLMISSSRETTLPATLQGKWNQSVAEIWGSCYCININLEMNYWFTGGANLLESGKSLVRWLNSQIPAGRITAKNMYGIEPKKYILNGNTVSFSGTVDNETDDVFIMHTKQGINGTTDKTGSESIQSPGNLAFLMYNIWDLYETSGDRELLANELYPILRKAANFYTQYMYANRKTSTNKQLYPNGYYYTTGSGRSPEHGPTQEGIKYDLQLVSGLFDYVIEAADILQEDEDKLAVWKEIRNNIEIPVELGTDGQIKEWAQETTYNTNAAGTALGDPYHRHISHLAGLYPGKLISRETPELLDGAKIVLSKRGDEATGWSIANKFLMWARVLDGDKALQLFCYQLAQRTYENLFDFHAPFQIDGNFGAAAGIMELLMQSQTGVIYILPALPKVWDKGSISGIKSKTGVEVSINWDANKATRISLIPSADGDIKIGYDHVQTIYVSDGQSTQPVTSTDNIFVIPGAKAGVELIINFSPELSIEPENNSETDFIVYPNPTNGIVYIQPHFENNNRNLSVDIQDIKGSVLTTFGISNEGSVIELSGIASSGVYFITLYDNDKRMATKKVILN